LRSLPAFVGAEPMLPRRRLVARPQASSAIASTSRSSNSFCAVGISLDFFHRSVWASTSALSTAKGAEHLPCLDVVAVIEAVPLFIDLSHRKYRSVAQAISICRTGNIGLSQTKYNLPARVCAWPVALGHRIENSRRT
jgi:hypothetical protein